MLNNRITPQFRTEDLDPLLFADVQRRVGDFLIKRQDRRPKAEDRQRGAGSRRKSSNPLPNQVCMGPEGAVSSPRGVRAEPRPPKGLPLFSALSIASPDTIILLIVDDHAAIEGKTPVSPLACAPADVQ